MSPRPKRPEPLVCPADAHLSQDVDDVRQALAVYARLSAMLPGLLRNGDRLDVSISEMARLAGIDRGRVHRAIRVGRDQNPDATRETGDELAENVRNGVYHRPPWKDE